MRHQLRSGSVGMLTAMLARAGYPQARVEPAEITLEDVFTELATRQPAGPNG